jgi:hypothetical protein
LKKIQDGGRHEQQGKRGKSLTSRPSALQERLLKNHPLAPNFQLQKP